MPPARGAVEGQAVPVAAPIARATQETEEKPQPKGGLLHGRQGGGAL